MENTAEKKARSEKLSRGSESLQEALKKIDMFKKSRKRKGKTLVYGSWTESNTLVTPKI